MGRGWNMTDHEGMDTGDEVAYDARAGWEGG